MDANTKVGVIIGCSLAVAAFIFIIVLLLVCFCSRKATGKNTESNRSDSARKTTIPTELERDKARNVGQRWAGDESHQSQFIRTGSQLWRSNVTLAAVSPRCVATIDKLPSDLQRKNTSNTSKCDAEEQAEQQNNPNQHKVPWYERTIAKASQFMIHRPLAYHSKNESGEHFAVVDRNSGTTGDGVTGTNPFNNQNQSGEIPSIDRYISTSSSESSGNAYVIYGSRTALLPNYDVTNNPDRRGRGSEAVNHAYVTERNRTSDQCVVERDKVTKDTVLVDRTRVDRVTIDRDPSHSAGVNMITGDVPIGNSIANLRSVQTLIRRFESSNSADISSRQSSEGQYLSPRDLRKVCSFNSSKLSINVVDIEATNKFSPSPQNYLADNQPALSSSQFVSRENVLSSPRGKHPTRPDTPLFNPHRVNEAPLDRCQHNESHVVSQPCYVNKGAMVDTEPRYVNYLNSYSEEKRIQDAFKFLDDMEE